MESWLPLLDRSHFLRVSHYIVAMFVCLFISIVLVLRPGSVVAEFQLSFKNNLEDEKALTPLKRAVQDGKLGSLTVDPESLKIKKDVEGNWKHP